MLRRLALFLEIHEAKYEEIKRPTRSAEPGGAEAAGFSVGSLARVAIVKDRLGLGIAILSAAREVDFERLRGVTGSGPVHAATADEVRRAFPGCEAEAIPPFGRLFAVRTFAELALVSAPEIIMPGGDRGTAIRMCPSEYLRLADAQIGRFAGHALPSFTVSSASGNGVALSHAAVA